MRSTITTSSADARTASGSVSRTRTPVSSATWSLRALEMLDVDRREHVDPRFEHVLPRPRSAFVCSSPGGFVWASSSIRASSGARSRRSREVHLLERGVPVGDPAARDDREALGLGGGRGATVRLEVADHHVAPRLRLGLRLLEHAIGLADAGGHPKDRPGCPRVRAAARSGSEDVVDHEVDKLDPDERRERGRRARRRGRCAAAARSGRPAGTSRRAGRAARASG